MSAASPAAPAKASARDRLLAAADELFYSEGIHTVGIDRIIERAGVAKASLYSSFGSKDELVRAYLEARHERRRARVMAGIGQFDNPRDRLLGVFNLLCTPAQRPNYRGCAFYNATAESESGSVAEEVATKTRAWARGLFAQLATDAGVRDPEAFANQLVLLYDGAMVGARMEPELKPAATASLVAAALLDAATD
jgi:AcrR family transcriptional regulator